MNKLKSIARLFKVSATEWSNDKASRLGAALSYYTIFSLAPVLLLVIAVAGMALGREAAQGKIVEQLQGLLGADAAKAIQTMLEKASQHGKGIIATVVGLLSTRSGRSSRNPVAASRASSATACCRSGSCSASASCCSSRWW
jgi:membrane protein